MRAFSVYCQLVKIAERYHRIRRRRQYESSLANPPQKASLRGALTRLEEEGMGGEELGCVLEGLSIRLVLMAHPTETQRRSVCRRHPRIGRILESVAVESLTPPERRQAENRLAEEITVLWQTDELRVERPEAEDEIRRTLLFFERPLISSTRDVYRSLEDEIARRFPEGIPSIMRVLEFGSWVGGDQDGNPFVKSQTVSTALGLHRDLILNRHIGSALSGGASAPVREARGDLRGVEALSGALRAAPARLGPRAQKPRVHGTLPVQDAARGRPPAPDAQRPHITGGLRKRG